MERIAETEYDQAAIDAFRTDRGVTMSDVVQPGTNLVIDDHLRIVDAFNVVVVAPEGGSIWCYVWGQIMPFGDLQDYVTDRIGPNGETMPIFDDEEEEEPSPAPPQGQQQQQRQPKAKLSKAERHAKRYDLQAFLKAQSPETAKLVREHLRARGLLTDGDDKPADKGKP
jgi:hypothetical protein